MRWRPPRTLGARRFVPALLASLACTAVSLVTAVAARPQAVARERGSATLTGRSDAWASARPLCVECDWLVGADACVGECVQLERARASLDLAADAFADALARRARRIPADPAWCTFEELAWGDEDVTLTALLLRVDARHRPARPRTGTWRRIAYDAEQALVWLPRQQRVGGSFPGDDLAQAQAARALGEVGPLPGSAQPWLYGATAPARALARAFTRTPAERWSAPRTWRDVALDPRPGTLPLRLDPTRADVQALLRALVATQRPDGTWTHVVHDPTPVRPELATAINALLLACALFEPDGTLSRGAE